jgi:hypothetical protein
MLFARTRKSIPSPFSLALLSIAGVAAGLTAQAIAPVSWSDLPAPIQQRLERSGLDRTSFPAWTTALRARHAARVLEGDEDHLVFYALQSTRITPAAPIEPALSARTLVSSLDADARTRFLANPDTLKADRIPQDARARLRALVRAVETASTDQRLGYFRTLLQKTAAPAAPRRAPRETAEARVDRAYLRAMRFLAEQERAGRTEDAAGAVATLYRTRGLSTDTSVEAGFLIREGLATLRALESGRRIHRVVIVGPGLDLAPRTGLQESIPPQSVQPFAVADALVSLGMADLTSLRITCLDINPRVVRLLDGLQKQPVTLTLAPTIAASDRMTPSEEYRRYVETLGLAIGSPITPTAKRVAITGAVGRAITTRELDIVLDRLPLEADLVVITNVLPYLDDRELTMALANIAAMLAPGGTLLHNEARAEVGAITSALGLPLVQSRTAVLATLREAPPLYDSVFIHVRK